MLTTIISFIIVLGILVFIHEFGHYMSAKAVGIRVEEFALGFGPKLISTKKGDTVYSIRIVPLGGYCKMTGETLPDEDMSAEELAIYNEAREKGQTFDQKSPWQRLLVIFDGPLMNFVLAILIFALIFGLYGLPVDSTDSNIIDNIEPGMPAAQAGFKLGDKIVEINGQQVENWGDVQKIINNSVDEELKFVVLRNGEKININVTPKYIDQLGRSLIGIGNETVNKDVGFFEALKLGAINTWRLIVLMIVGIIDMIRGNVPGDIAGPVMIADMVGQAARIGFRSVLELTALLSVNLGLLNLLPIPALDGGHILFIFVEIVRGKPLKPSVENMINIIGFSLLMLLMVFVIFRDIGRLIF